MAGNTPGARLMRNLNAKIAAIPMVLTTLVVFVGGTIWTVCIRASALWWACLP